MSSVRRGRLSKLDEWSTLTGQHFGCQGYCCRYTRSLCCRSFAVCRRLCILFTCQCRRWRHQSAVSQVYRAPPQPRTAPLFVPSLPKWAEDKRSGSPTTTQSHWTFTFWTSGAMSGVITAKTVDNTPFAQPSSLSSPDPLEIRLSQPDRDSAHNRLASSLVRDHYHLFFKLLWLNITESI